MKIWISVDMEGISGIVDRDQVMPDGGRYERGRRFLMGDVQVVLDQLEKDSAVDQIVVNDSHDGMVNVLWDELPHGVELISGGGKPLSMNEGMLGADAAFFIGYHAMAGTSGAIWDHTYASNSIYSVKINGRLVGETGINAAVAGHYGVPVALVTGDDKVAQEASALLPGVQVAVVKEGINRRAALLKSREKTTVLLREAVDRALTAVRTHEAPVWRIEAPVSLEVALLNSDMADRALYCPGTKRIDGRSVGAQFTDMFEAFRGFYTWMALASQSAW